MAIRVGGEIFFTFASVFFQCVLSPHVEAGGKCCTIQFSHITNYRDISYENIYVVSMSTLLWGGGRAAS